MTRHIPSHLVDIAKLDSVNVVFGSDRAFLPYTAVALRSLLSNYKSDRRLRIFLLVDQPLIPDDRRRFDSLLTVHPFELNIIQADASAFKNIKTTAGISTATYYRLYAHLLLPFDVNKAIWLDGDLIVRADISQLFDTEMDNALFAGVEDSFSKLYRRRFNLEPTTPHINCGVLVLNVAGMRAANTLPKIENFISKNKYTIELGDQQIINVLFKDRLKLVSLKWNFHGFLLEGGIRPELNDFSMREIIEAANDPAIMHYCGKIKPWSAGARTLKNCEWNYHASQSPYWDRLQPVNATVQTMPPVERGSTIKRIWGRIRRRSRERRHTIRALQKDALRAEKTRAIVCISLRAQMQSILLQRGQKIATRDFCAYDFVKSLPENSIVALSGNNEDLTGGFHENLKNILRTPNIATDILPANADFSMMLVQTVESDRQWSCLLASQMGVDIIFAEASFFGAYAGYYDSNASFLQKKAFGYILDDMGYFFDASQPSRLETILNTSTFSLRPDEIARCKKLIQRIKTEKITKYNKYAGRECASIQTGAVLVVDQKLDDASVLFGGGSEKTFRDMISAAVKENPGRQVYLKRHPDNVHNERSAFSNVPLGVHVLPNDFDVTSILDSCDAVYTVSSQVGFEALLRDKRVVTFGVPFYSGWGLTDDRQRIRRRTQIRTVEDLFHTACITMSVYYDPQSHELIEIEQAFDLVRDMRMSDQQDRLAFTTP